RHLDRGVIPRQLRTIEFRPEAPDLDAHRSLDLRRFDGRQHRRVPALRRVSGRLNEPYDDRSCGSWLRSTSGHSFRVYRSVAQGLHDQILLELGHRFLEERLLDGDLVAAVLLMVAGLVIAEGKLATCDYLPAREDDRALDDVLELAHVAGPVVFHETFQGLFADRRRLCGRAVAVFCEAVLDERGDVLLAIAERRHVDADDIKPVADVVTVVQRLGNELFPGARFTGNENGRVGFGDLADGLVHLLHRWRVADDPLGLDERADLVAQHLYFAREVAVLDHPLHRVADLVELER